MENIVIKRLLLFIAVTVACVGQTTTMIDWNTQIRNKPNLVNPTFTNVTAGSLTSGWVNSNALYVAQTNGTSGGTGGYIEIAPTTYPGTSCTDVFGNVVNQPVLMPGLPAFGTNDTVMWVSRSPEPGATPPGCLPSPFSAQQVYGLNVSTYVYSLVGFATNRKSFNSFESLSGGLAGLSVTASDYVYPGAYAALTAIGPPDPWGRIGTVNTSGNAVTLSCVPDPPDTITPVCEIFFGGITGPVFGGFMTINGTQYSVASVTDATHLTLTTSAGTQTNAPYIIHGWGIGAISFSYASNCMSLYSSTGAWACLSGGGGGGTPGTPLSSVQFNNSGAFGGSANFLWNNTSGVLSICTTLGGACTVTSGVDAQAFSSSAVGTSVGFTNATATFTILGNGQGNFNTLNAGAGSPFTVSVSGLVGGVTFGSSATGTTHAFTTNSGNAFINGDGSGNFNTLAIGVGPALTVSSNGTLVIAGTYGLTNAGALTVASCSGCGGSGSPGSPAGSVQFNNSGAFGGSANFGWSDGAGILSICTTLGGSCTATSGVDANAFSSSATGSAVAYTDVGANFTILGNGQGNFATLNAGIGPAFTVASNGSLLIAGTYGLTNGGALTVASCSGCGGAGSPGAPSTSIQFNNAGTFAGNANMTWNNGSGNLSICTTLGGICSATSGVNAQAFSSSATGGATAYTDVGANFTINGAGAGAFSSLAVGGGSPFNVTNAGNTTTANLTVTGTCTGCGGGGGTPAAPATSVQFNNSGVFGGNANFEWNNSTGNLSVCQTLGGICGSTSGVNAQVFSSNASGGATGYTNSGATFTILGSGQANFQTLNVGSGAPFTVSVGGNVGLVGLTASSTATFNGNLAGTHGQNVGTSDNPNFRAVSTGTNNGSVATGGAGATFANSLTGDSAFFFDNAGVCKINSGIGTLFCASDRRLKQNIQPLASGLNTVMALKPSTWDWISNGSTGVGFIAQEVLPLVPSAVSKIGDYYALSKDTLVPYLVKAIQEQQVEIEQLQHELSTSTPKVARN